MGDELELRPRLCLLAEPAQRRTTITITIKPATHSIQGACVDRRTEQREPLVPQTRDALSGDREPTEAEGRHREAEQLKEKARAMQVDWQARRRSHRLPWAG